MKKIKQLGKIGFFALAFSFASCSSDSDGSSTGGVAADGTISATVDGTSFTTLQAATVGIVNGSADYQILALSGADATGKSLSINIAGFTGLGTYSADGANDVTAVLVYSALDFNNPQNTNNVWSAPYDVEGTSGTVTVTESTSDRVKGTFSFKGASNAGLFKQVTNGSFNVKFTQ